MVYELCLVVGNVVPRQRIHQDSRLDFFPMQEWPQTQLLLISHQVRQEAAEVFFQKNHFIMSYADTLEAPYDDPPGHRKSWLFIEFATTNLRWLSITLEMREWDPTAFRQSVEGLRSSIFSPGSNGMIAPQWQSLVHNCIAARYVQNSFWIVAPRCERLAFLQVDFQECFCHAGCCRLVSQFAEAVTQHWGGPLPKVMECWTPRHRGTSRDS